MSNAQAVMPHHGVSLTIFLLGPVSEATCPVMGGANQAIEIIKIEQDMILRVNPANSSFQKKSWHLKFENV